jgi:hypothetical protein
LFDWDHVGLGYKVQSTRVDITLNNRLDIVMLQMKRLRGLLLLATLAWTTQGHAAEWASDLPDGSTLPMLAAPDTQGVLQTNDTLMGENGLLLQFNRSSDW